MTPVQLYIIFICCLTIAVTVIARSHLHSSTVSRHIRNWAIENSWVGYCAGYTIAHWFFPTKEILFQEQWGWMPGTIPALALILFDLWWKRTGRPRDHVARWPFWYFLIGVLFGAIFWPMKWAGAPI